MSTYFEQGSSRYRLPPPIKITPTTASIRSFSGTYNDFPATEFITLCEDVIKKSSIIEDADKISLSIFMCTSALNLMQSGAFNLADNASDYEQFKQNFMKVFGDHGRELLVKQVSHTIDNFQN